MRVRCPDCHSPIEVVSDASLAKIDCPSCGSSFSLIGGDITETHHHEPRRLAQFELVHELGAGRFGSVWLARDTELDRTVAVKIPHKGVLDAAETEKFFRDARAAAQLRHPNIVGVHEVGRDQDTLYIVTDYIKGANLKEWLTGQRLSFRESAELLVKVAEALLHAHESGVVHRDLKPGNIMMDAAGQPYVIDFGLARREAGEKTMTIDGHILGTPAYMSPEQAAGKGHTADRRSDVYALGVILFELLTGELPFRGETRMLLLQIERDEPPRPRKLNARVPRDLETIALKCLEKDPGKRYQTARDLADDLRHWLNGKPIAARPVGRVERGWRWCRRNPLVAGLAATVAVALVTGTVASSYFALQASAKAREALAERERAEAGFREARQAVDKYFTTVSESQLLNVPSLQPLRKELLEAALEHYQNTIGRSGNDPKARAEMAAAYSRVATITREIASQEESLTAYGQALNIYQALALEFPAATEYQIHLGRTYLRLGKIQAETNRQIDAEASFKNAIDVYARIPSETSENNDAQAGRAEAYAGLGRALVTRNRYSDAIEFYTKSGELYEGLVRDQPAIADYQRGLGWTYLNLGYINRMTARQLESQAFCKKAIEVFERLIRENPTVADYQNGLAVAFQEIVHVVSRESEAESFHKKSIDLIERLVTDNPAVSDYQHRLATAYNALGSIQRQVGRVREAAASHNRATKIYGRLVRENPTVSPYMKGFVTSYQQLLAIPLSGRQQDDPESDAREAIVSLKEIAKSNAAIPGLESTLASALSLRGDALAMLKRWREAAEAYAEAVRANENSWMFRWQWALLQQAAGDVEGYRRTCDELLDGYGDTTDPRRALAITLACTVGQAPTDKMEKIVALATMAFNSDKTNPAFGSALGGAQYRAGHNKAAIDTLKRSLPLHAIAGIAAPQMQDAIQSSRIFAETFLALAYYREGDSQAFDRQLTTTRALIAQLEKSPPPAGVSVGPWAFLIAIELSNRELARLKPLTTSPADPLATPTNGAP